MSKMTDTQRSGHEILQSFKYAESTPAYTPGPWRVYPKGVMVPGYQVCERIVADKYFGGLSESPNDADAKLIAAAPDLLKAIQFALANDSGLSDASCDKMRAALAKAVG